MSNYVAVLLRRKPHAKAVDLLAEKLKQTASVYPDRSFGPERDGHYAAIMNAAREEQKVLMEQGIKSVVLREEPFVRAADNIDFKAYLMIWKPGILNRKTEIRTLTKGRWEDI